jgi:hypothetical protein
MPIAPPLLDDRDYDSLVAELIARIPAHTPEWTQPRTGDPGVTLVELFAWLADTVLYRANLIPQRQRVAFLRLVGQRLRPALSARGWIGVSVADATSTAVLELPAGSPIEQPLPFETEAHLTVLPLRARLFIKRRLSGTEAAQAGELLDQLQDLYELPARPEGYVTHEVFAEGATSSGVDMAAQALDRSLWFALTATTPESVGAVRTAIGTAAGGARRRLNVGLALAPQVEARDITVGQHIRVPHRFSLTTGAITDDERAAVLELEPEDDTTGALSRSGTVRLALPDHTQIGVPGNDPRQRLRAGVGDNPPRVDDPALAARLVGWLRLELLTPAGQPPPSRFVVGWAGINVVAIEQRRSVGPRIIGTGDGGSGQSYATGLTQVDAERLEIQVEDAESGAFLRWHRLDDVGSAGPDERAFACDAEAGTVAFGDGVHGAAPASGMRIRAAALRAGGGTAGNLPAGTLKKATHPDGTALALRQPLPLTGGAEAETLAEAERRIPRALRHRDRAVTAADYADVLRALPRGDVARTEVLGRFKPHERIDVPGVVSVMVWPVAVTTPALVGAFDAPYPRADRLLLQAVHAWLEPRHPVATELYAIGCEYVPLAVSIGVRARDGHAIEVVLPAVRAAIRRHVWPLPPGGPDGDGWPLGRPVDNREVEVVAARVEGVAATTDVRLFEAEPTSLGTGRVRWREIAAGPDGRVRRAFERYQLPELLALAVVDGDTAPVPDDAMRARDDGGGAGVPIVPEVC